MTHSPEDKSGKTWLQQAYPGQVTQSDPDAFDRASRQRVERSGQPAMPGGFGPGDTPLDQMENYEKLHGIERWVMDRLPGIKDVPVLGAVVGGLEKFGATTFGANVFKVLDAPAELIERSTGFMTQYAAAMGDADAMQEINDNIGATWRASSLTYENTEIPYLDLENGKMMYSGDLPGLDGIIAARKEIIGLVAGGMDATDALEQVRNNMLAGAGALAIRMQMKDAIGHVFADPLNVLGLLKKPIQAAKLRSIGTALRKSDAAVRGAYIAEAVKAAEVLKTGSVAADKAWDVVRKLENIEELSNVERFMLRAVGAVPNIAAEPGRFGKLWRKVNPLGLTPESRAMSLGKNITDNLGMIIAHSNPEEAAVMLQRFVDGTFDPRIAHLVITPEGQLTRGMLQMSGAKGMDLLAAWRNSSKMRAGLNNIAAVLGESADDVMRILFESEEAPALLKRLTDVAARSGKNLDELLVPLGLDAASLTVENLAKALAPMTKTNMWSVQAFQQMLMTSVAGGATKFAVAKFGVQARGFIPRLADAIKSAESMAFLRLNPGYAIRNFLNNEITMIARGVWGEFSVEAAGAFWKRVGFEPARLRSGFGPAGMKKFGVLGTETFKVIGKEIDDVARGNRGFLERISDKINNINLGPADMASLSGNLESKASIRAFTRGFKNYWRRHRKPLGMKEWNPQVWDELVSELGEGTVARLEARLKDAVNDAEVDDILKLTEIEAGVEEVVEGAEKILGSELSGIIPDDELDNVVTQIMDGYRASGEQGARDAAETVFARIERDLDDGVDFAIKDWVEGITNHVEAEGPLGAVTQWHNSNADLWNGAHVRWARMQDEIARAARVGSYDAAKEIWERGARDGETYWRRTFRIIEARTTAIEQGLKKLAGDDYKHVDGMVNVQKKWQSSWQKMIKDKNGRMAKHFGTDFADDAARNASWEDVLRVNDEAYTAAGKMENSSMREMDNLMGRLVPEELQDAYAAGRKDIRSLVSEDRRLVSEFREQLRTVPFDEQEAAYQALNKQRIEGWNRVAQQEQQLAAALRGNPEAIGNYQKAAQIQNNLVRDVSEGVAEVSDSYLTKRASYLTGNVDAIKQSDELATAVRSRIDFLAGEGELVNKANPTGVFDQFVDNIRHNRLVGAEQIIEGDKDIARAVKEIADELDQTVDDIYQTLSDGASKPRSLEAEYEILLEELRIGIEAPKGVDQWQYAWQVRSHKSRAFREVVEGLAAKHGQSPETITRALIEAPSDGRLKILSAPDATTFDMVGGHIVSRSGDWLDEGSNMFYLNKIETLSQRQGAGTEAMMELFSKALDNGKVRFHTSPTSNEGLALYKSLEHKGIIRAAGFEIVQEGPMKGSRAPIWELVPEEIRAQIDLKTLPPGQYEDAIGSIFEADRHRSALWHVRGREATEALVSSTAEANSRQVSSLSGLTADGQNKLQRFSTNYKSQMSTDRLAAMKFGEYSRDSALLNYNMRINADAWLSNIFPYEFWPLHSAFRWGMHSIDRPTMGMMYLRFQKFLNEGMRPESGLPRRFKGHIRIPAPFLPDFLGDELFVDPFATALPFKQWGFGIEQVEKLMSQNKNQVPQELRGMLEEQIISQEEYDAAVETQSGPAWDRALSRAQQNDAEGELNAFDAAAALVSPHAPLLWAHHLAKGEPEKIQPFIPLTRTIKGVSALLGISPNTGGVNIEGALRSHIGLPPFDNWEDYRVDRMLANMVVDEGLSVEEAQQAMLTRTGEAFTEATRRAGVEYGIQAFTGLLMRAKAYPPGEEHLRKLGDDYSAAWDAYNRGQDDALQNFYEENPEYEARQLALYSSPEEKLQKYLVDNVWDGWNGMTTQNKREVADQLGPIFTEAFLDKETRDISTIPTETLQYWAIVMGQDAPGEFHWDNDKHPIELTSPEDSAKLEAWYRTRQVNYRYAEEIAPLLDVYYDLDPGRARRNYKASHPIINSYFKYRQDFMMRNPSLAPYIEDDPKRLPTFRSPEQREEVFSSEPSFSWIEWQNVLGTAASRLAVDAMRREGTMDVALAEELEFQANRLGMDPDDLFEDLRIAYEER